MNEVTEVASASPVGVYVLVGAFIVLLGYRVYKSKKDTGTLTGGLFGGGGKRTEREK